MFWNTFYAICKEKGTSPNAVCKAIGLSNATATGWKNGTMPKADVLVKIADYLEISIDYMLGRSEEKENTASRENAKSRIDKIIQKKDLAELIQLEEIAHQLPEKDIEDLLHYAELLLLKQKVHTDKADQSDV